MHIQSKSRIARHLYLLKSDERGVTITEFALVLTPLLMLIMGGLDAGYQVYLIPTRIDHDPCAHLRRPSDIIRHG